MKANRLLFFLLLAVVIFFASCSIEKRHYRQGYYVQWKTPVKVAKVESTIPENTAQAMIAYEEIKKKPVVLENKIQDPELKSISVVPLENPKKIKCNVPLPLEITHEIKKEHKRVIISAPVSKRETYTQYTKNRDPLGDTIRILFAVIFLILGIPPLAVIIVGGTGRDISINLLFWLIGLLLILLSILAFDAGFGLLMITGLVLLLLSYIHAVVIMVKSIVD